MRAALRTLLAVGLIAISLALTTAPAAACSCAGGTDQDHFGLADAVFTGTVVGYEYEDDPDGDGLSSSTDPAYWTFEVDLVFKGTVAPVQVVESAVSGASCGLEIPHEGEFVVFARTAGSDEIFGISQPRLAADLCGGTRSIADEAPRFAATGSPPTAAVAPEPTVDPGGEILPDDVEVPTTTDGTPPSTTSGAGTDDADDDGSDPESGGVVLVVGFIAVGIAAAFVAARLARRSRGE